ncbi:hypothetical protein THTE_3211 [Thermogutta terrifontis]|uniref:Uncharacterized protein n=1 Tax=Thermogutta terrifontis TaxID=1331910 RepID=A0A286RIN3_9BACT|nr:hypothetical protein THTE_3211 [Thermogutta terrifontis]
MESLPAEVSGKELSPVFTIFTRGNAGSETRTAVGVSFRRTSVRENSSTDETDRRE